MNKFTICIAALALCGAATSANAQFNATWHSINTGGGLSTGGAFRLTSTIGQPAATPTISGSSNQDLTSGFLAGFPGCVADFNGDCLVASQDFFDFLSALFAGDPAADLNRDGFVASQDFFDFLAAFFNGC